MEIVINCQIFMYHVEYYCVRVVVFITVEEGFIEFMGMGK